MDASHRGVRLPERTHVDGWLCGDCKSLNTPRAMSCYRCNVPRRSGERTRDDPVQAALVAAAEANAASKVGRYGTSGPSGAAGAPGANGLPGASMPVLSPVARPPSSVPGAGPYTAWVSGIPAAPDPFGTGVHTGRPAVPRRAVGVLGLAVLLVLAGGVMLSGGRPPDPDRDPAAAIAAGLRSLHAVPPPPPISPAATAGPAAVTAPPSQPPAWQEAAERLATGTFAEDWVGRMNLDATLKVGDRPAIAWTFSVARAGSMESSRTRVEGPAAGVVTTTETVLLSRSVWTRTDGAGWERRDRGFGDQPTEPLFGVRDADGFVFARAFREDGRPLFQYRMPGASDLLALAFLRDMGVGRLSRSSAIVVTDRVGVPVRAELVYGGTTRTGKARLEVHLSYRDVGGTFTIRSPRDGDPVVD